MFLGWLGLPGCASVPQHPGQFEEVKSLGGKVCVAALPAAKSAHLPKLETLSPLEGATPGGNQIKITGRGFRPGVQAFLGDVLCGVLNYVNETTLTCTSLSHAPGVVNVTVVNPDQSCDSISDGFRYSPVVQMSSKRVRLSVGDQFKLNVQNGTPPLQFSVVDGLGHVDPQTGVYTASEPPGTAMVEVQDAKGGRDSAVIQIRPPLTVSASLNQIAVGGTAFLSVVGGVGPYTFTVDPELGAVDNSTGRVTALRPSDDVVVQVADFLNHQDSVHFKFLDSVHLIGPEKIEVNHVGQIDAKGGVPPYIFVILSGLGTIDPTGQFTAPDRPASTVISAKDSMGNLAQISVVTIPGLSLTPSQTEVLPNGTAHFTAMGGFMPYSFRLTQGIGQVDPVLGNYKAPDTSTSDIIEVKDAHNSTAFARVEVHSRIQSRSISSSLSHTCALSHGAAKCWGENQFGQLGDGTLLNKLEPAAVSGLEENVASIATGYRHSCALLGSGAVKCWGDNSKGQLGIQAATKDEIEQSSTPRTVAGLNRGVVAIAAGQYHTCAIQDSKVFCWGDNSKGQLGSAVQGISRIPVQTSQISEGVQLITAGAFHSCAIVNGGAKCWGWNYNGQLGNRSRLDSEEPVDVLNLSQGVQRIESKGNHTCAQTQSGLFCWGYNASGQLGIGSTKIETAPVPVLGIDGSIEEISLGSQHTCVRVSVAPKVRCWGFNYFGQLGKASSALQAEPQVVSLPDSVTALGAGVNHTCVLLGDLYSCWGHNSSGQLGDRTRKDRAIPEVGVKLD